MAQLTQTTPRTQARAVIGAGLALTGLATVLRAVDFGAIPGVQNFLLVFSSLLIEAVPFVLLGALVSAAIEVLVPARLFERMASLPGPLQLPASALAGIAFPVCECGSVPVARRLAAKGLSPAAAVTFMLAAPILNPVVIASTVVAYRGRDTMWVMVGGRALLGLLAAIAVGWVVAGKSRGTILRADPHAEIHDGHRESRASAFFSHLSGDFVFMARYLVLGAAVAATLQTFVPQTVLGSVADTPIIALVSMMGLAFVLSLCSESDAFVAASFVQFGPGAQLAFLVFGPMVDVKLGFLYSATFDRNFLPVVVGVVGGVTLVGTLWVEVLFG
jgi:uncharacterized protein